MLLGLARGRGRAPCFAEKRLPFTRLTTELRHPRLTRAAAPSSLGCSWPTGDVPHGCRSPLRELLLNVFGDRLPDLFFRRAGELVKLIAFLVELEGGHPC